MLDLVFMNSVLLNTSVPNMYMIITMGVTDSLHATFTHDNFLSL